MLLPLPCTDTEVTWWCCLAVSVLEPVVLAQRRVSLAKMAEKKRKEDKSKQGDQAR